LDQRISILGCGWLGYPLAIRLIASGWQVKGSTTTTAKLRLLKSHGIDAYLVQLSNSPVNNQFLKSDVLLLNVPPSLKKQSAEIYLEQMRALAQQVNLSPIKQVIFISSTSVYPDANSEIINVDEVDIQSPLYQSEQLFRTCADITTTVVRFAGLIGPGRNPSRFFAGKQNVGNGRAPVNLIHLDDCIGIIEAVLDQQKFGGTYHAAAPTHPSRNEFYTLAAQNDGLPLPGFIDETSEWKIINADKIVAALSYQFIYPDLLRCITERAC
jgi:nucleoside-diphosphate-sugar epimerase